MRRLLPWLLGLLLLFVPAWPEPVLRTGAYVQDVTPTSAVIALVERGIRELEVVARAEARPEIRVRDTACRRHVLRLTGLEPRTRYEYEVRDAEGTKVAAGHFRTFPASTDAELRFCVVGDSGAVPSWVWLQGSPLVQALDAVGLLWASHDNSALGTAMAALEPDLWLHVGDMVYPYGQERHSREAFFRPFAPLLAISPCYAVLGNHDLGNESEHSDQGRALLRNLVLPRGATTGDERCYSFACGPVRFVALDLNATLIGSTTEHAIHAGHPAFVHLERELAAAKEPWLVVFSHYPMWSGSRGADNENLKATIKPLLEKAKVDVLFAGHDHVYQHMEAPSGLVQITTGGGGKSLYELKQHPLTKAEAAKFHFCEVTVVGAQMKIRALTAKGKLLDEFTIARKAR